ncbi:MAG: hypothetical protein PVJ34_03775 [Anaerolineae bacterium]|jgi:hypothetical protein
MNHFRRNILASGFAGLLACLLLAAFATWLVTGGRVKPPFPPFLPLTLVLVAILGGFSLLEVPLMVYALRRLAIERQANHKVVVGMNTLYVAFAAAYGLPILFITGDLTWSLALCSLSLVRFASSLLFVRQAAP